jgi:hypothetical protein
MKKFMFILMTVFMTVAVSAQQRVKLEAERSGLSIIFNNGISFTGSFALTELNLQNVVTPKGPFTDLAVPGFAFRFNDGNPAIPLFSQLIEIPGHADVNIKVTSYTSQTINLSDYGIYDKLVPAQPSYSKGTDPEDIVFVYNHDAYQVNDFTQGELIQVEYQGMMRGVGLARLIIDPVRYNPVTNQLLIYNNIEFEIEYVTNVYHQYLEEKDRVYSPLFQSAYQKLPNFITPTTKDLITQYPIKYVIVSHHMFRDSLQQFVQWKTQKGYNVVEAYTDDPVVGTTTSSIKSYLQGLYNAGTPQDPAPTFILIVGDIAQVPAFSGSAGSHVSDMYYGEYTGGSDYIPEVYIGRFSATSIAQLMPQINKTIQYEKYTMPASTYMDTAIFVAGYDASGYDASHGNPTIIYATNNYFNSAHGFYSWTYLDPNNRESMVGADMRSKLYKGFGFANYTAHCNSNGWGEPSFTTSHIPNMTNTDKYALMIGNCCLSNKFNDSECFGEAVLRVANKGAVGYIGGSNNTYWNEDYWWGIGLTSSILANPTYATSGLGAYDKVFHDHGEPYSDWFITNAQVNYAGNTAVQASSSSLKQYYWEIYHLMGDPSVMNYMSVPDNLSMSYTTPLMVGDQSLVVGCEPYTLVAISENNTLLDAKFSGPNSSVTLEFSALQNPGTVLIVGTKQNRAPHIQNVTVDEISVGVDAQVYEIQNIQPQYTCVDVNIQPEVIIRNKGINNLTQVTVNFQWDNGTVNQIAWTGNLSTMQTASVTLPQYFLTAGNHPLLVYTTNPNGTNDGNLSNDTLEMIVNAQNLPVNAEFSVQNTEFCDAPAMAEFTNLSQNAISYVWNFGDGNTSVLVNPEHEYATNGTYTVTLTADAGICGSDQKVYTNLIQIGSLPPVADFAANSTIPVMNTQVDLTDASTCSPTGWSWSFTPSTVTFLNGTSSTSQNPQVSFTQTGLYTVSLTVTNAFGNDSEVKSDYINVINCTYCSSTATNTSDEWITNVAFAGINNSSGSTGYSDFTNLSPAEVIPGNDYTLSTSLGMTGTWSEYFVAWIDWNQNCVFESNEQYQIGNCNSNGCTVSTTISVPSGAALGTTVMRVVMQYSSYRTDPCGTFTYGEVEDYAVNVISGISCNDFEETTNAQICEGSTYSWRGNNYSVSGTYYDSLFTTNPPGCDSVYILNLTVNPVFEFVSNAEICEGESYDWQGGNYTVGGTYTETYQTVDGCDSVYILNLTVNPVYEFVSNAEICEGDTYQWQGGNYTVGGTYTETYQTVNGCDSVYILNLTVNPVFEFVNNAEICEGDTYQWQGGNYTVGGTYTETYQTVNGCDSVYILNLTVNPVFEFVSNAEICEGDTYQWQGGNYTAGGTYTETYQTVNGCDSVYILNLTVNPVYEFVSNAEICEGDTYQWQGGNYTVGGTYTETYQTVNGCDSVYILNLTVNPVFEFVSNAEICEGESYDWQGGNYTVGGTYTETYQTVDGCDSVYILNLTVNPVYEFVSNAEICEGDTYQWQGGNYTAGGTYTETYQTVNGCDSVYILNLTVNPVFEFVNNAEICEGDTYHWQGGNYTAGGTYTETYQTVNGCDSVYILNLTVNPVFEFVNNAEICEGDTYQWQGGNYTVGGTYTETYQTVNGCDSVYIL